VYNKEGKLLTNQTTVIVDITIATKFVSAAERLEHHLAKTAPGTKKNKKNIIVERAQDDIFFCSMDQLAEGAPCR
jgi:hypothetical protein